MNILVTTLGSHGDVHPFLGIAQALKSRGHSVKVLANGHYESLVKAMDLEFVPVGTSEEFLAVARDPDIWHWLKGFARVAESMSAATPKCYQAILEHAVPGKTVLVFSTLAFGARLAQETLGLRGVTVHLSPAVFQSVYESPAMKGLSVPRWLPRWVKRALLNLSEAAFVDRIFGGPLNEYRAKLGLKPVRKVFSEWCHSPQRVIGLFPEWFAPPQPDWPKQAVLSGFPLFDERQVTPLPKEVDEFLNSGTKPIVFTPGSAMVHGHNFFAAGAEACGILGRRGLLLTRHSEQIPTDLPAGVIHAAYAPFSQLLPRCAALVHHGGIGSTAQALAAGIPQLMMPMGFDQPDNAQRIKRLGVGDDLPPGKFTAGAVAGKLAKLISLAEVSEACRRVAARLAADEDPMTQTVRLIEALEPRESAVIS